MLSDRTSRTLLAAVKNLSDQAAWTRLFEAYQPVIFAWAVGAGLSKADAEDVTQEVLRKLIEALPRFEYDPQRRFRAYLRKIVQNAACDLQRKRSREPRPIGDSDLQSWAELLPVRQIERLEPIISGLEERFNEQLSILRRACDEVRRKADAATWSAFELTYLDEVPAAEVAQRLGIKVANVYVYKQRIIDRLKAVVQRLSGEQGVSDS